MKARPCDDVARRMARRHADQGHLACLRSVRDAHALLVRRRAALASMQAGGGLRGARRPRSPPRAAKTGGVLRPPARARRQAVPTALRGAFQSCGQNCAGAERFIVHARPSLPNP